MMVIFWLLQEKRRFNQLPRDLSGITHRTLAKQLKEMEADGLVEREDFGEILPRVEYRLTPLGRSLERYWRRCTNGRYGTVPRYGTRRASSLQAYRAHSAIN